MTYSTITIYLWFAFKHHYWNRIHNQRTPTLLKKVIKIDDKKYRHGALIFLTTDKNKIMIRYHLKFSFKRCTSIGLISPFRSGPIASENSTLLATATGITAPFAPVPIMTFTLFRISSLHDSFWAFPEKENSSNPKIGRNCLKLMAIYFVWFINKI